jgi:zinc protease
MQYTRATLPNGLVLIVSEDHSTPLVAIEVSYHVGSMEDRPGQSGYAHFFEHMMFEGSRHVAPSELNQVARSEGGYANGFTDPDRQYYEDVVPRNLVATMLWMEADRMGTLLSRLDQTRFENERSVIENERLLEFENQPYAGGMGSLLTLATLFPETHPFRLAPIGTPADLAKATPKDMAAFFSTYYVPNNAVIAVVGDVKPAEVEQLVTRYFGGIARSATPVVRPTVHDPVVADERRVVLEDPRAKVPAFRMAWIGAAYHNPDKPALNALAWILNVDRIGALQKALILDHQLAAQVIVGNYDNEQAGIFQIDVAPRAGASLTTIEQVIDSVLADAKHTPPPARLVHAFTNRLADSIAVGLQPLLDRADTLAFFQQMEGAPTAYTREFERQEAVGPDDVMRVAAKYLTAGRMVMSIVPKGRLDLIAKPELPYVNATAQVRTLGGATP